MILTSFISNMIFFFRFWDLLFVLGWSCWYTPICNMYQCFISWLSLKWLDIFLVSSLMKHIKLLTHVLCNVAKYNLTLFIISSFENSKYIACVPHFSVLHPWQTTKLMTNMVQNLSQHRCPEGTTGNKWESVLKLKLICHPCHIGICFVLIAFKSFWSH